MARFKLVRNALRFVFLVIVECFRTTLREIDPSGANPRLRKEVVTNQNLQKEMVRGKVKARILKTTKLKVWILKTRNEGTDPGQFSKP